VDLSSDRLLMSEFIYLGCILIPLDITVISVHSDFTFRCTCIDALNFSAIVNTGTPTAQYLTHTSICCCNLPVLLLIINNNPRYCIKYTLIQPHTILCCLHTHKIIFRGIILNDKISIYWCGNPTGCGRVLSRIDKACDCDDHSCV
jgi:hypothetical protein